LDVLKCAMPAQGAFFATMTPGTMEEDGGKATARLTVGRKSHARWLYFGLPAFAIPG
jgi:hypothetical protein